MGVEEFFDGSWSILCFKGGNLKGV